MGEKWAGGWAWGQNACYAGIATLDSLVTSNFWLCILTAVGTLSMSSGLKCSCLCVCLPSRWLGRRFSAERHHRLAGNTRIEAAREAYNRVARANPSPTHAAPGCGSTIQLSGTYGAFLTAQDRNLHCISR